MNTFSGLEDEGHAFPTGIVDPERRRCESRARGIWRHGIVIEVTWFPVRGHILAEESVLTCDRLDCAQNFDLMWMSTPCLTNQTFDTYLFITDIFGREGHRSLHGQDAEHLKQIFFKGGQKLVRRLTMRSDARFCKISRMIPNSLK